MSFRSRLRNSKNRKTEVRVSIAGTVGDKFKIRLPTMNGLAFIHSLIGRKINGGKMSDVMAENPIESFLGILGMLGIDPKLEGRPEDIEKFNGVCKKAFEKIGESEKPGLDISAMMKRDLSGFYAPSTQVHSTETYNKAVALLKK